MAVSSTQWRSWQSVAAVLLLVSWCVLHWLGPIILKAVYVGDLAIPGADKLMEAIDSTPFQSYSDKLHHLINLTHILAACALGAIVAFREKSTAFMTGALAVGDTALIIYSYRYGSPFSILVDGGIGEFYGYGKELAMAGLFAVLYRKAGRAPLFAALSFLCFWLFIDDALRYHERAGYFIGELLNPALIENLPPGIRPRDVGEVIAQVIAGFVVLGVVAFTFLRSETRVRVTGAVFVGLVFLLAAFGTVLDFFDRIPVLGMHPMAAAHLEDGGELLVLTIMVGFATSSYWRYSNVEEADKLSD
jgi:hypothetical protein